MFPDLQAFIELVEQRNRKNVECQDLALRIAFRALKCACQIYDPQEGILYSDLKYGQNLHLLLQGAAHDINNLTEMKKSFCDDFTAWIGMF